MTVIPFKRPAVALAEGGAQSPKVVRRKATLTVAPLAGKPKAKDLYPLGTGELTLAFKDIDGKKEVRLTHKDPVVLGMAAVIAGAESVQVLGPELPELGTKINGQFTVYREIRLIEDKTVELFVLRFITGFEAVKYGRKLPKSSVDRFSEQFFPLAYALVPPKLRVVERIERGVYDEAGMVMSAKQIAREVKFGRMLGNFKQALAGDAPAAPPKYGEIDSVGFIRLPWEQIVSVEDEPHYPVAINGQAFAAVQRMLYPLGFKRMPATWAELKMAHYLAESVGRAYDQSLGAESQRDWARATLRVAQKNRPEIYPLLEAIVNKDMARVEALHGQTDWLAVLGSTYRKEFFTSSS